MPSSDPTNALIGWTILVVYLIVIITVLFHYFQTRIHQTIAFQWDGKRLVGKEKEELPAEVTDAMKDAGSPFVCRAEVVIWNAGHQTLHGSDIAANAPLRIVVAPGYPPRTPNGRIVRFRMRSATQEGNAFTIRQDPEHSNVGLCTFDYLEPGDGVQLEVLFTGTDDRIHLSGTVGGEVVWNWGKAKLCEGDAPPPSWWARHSPYLKIAMGAAGWVLILVEFSIGAVRHPHELFSRSFSRSFMEGLNLFFIFPMVSSNLVHKGITNLRKIRGRFPIGLSNT
jgi:hypothetical protein